MTSCSNMIVAMTTPYYIKDVIRETAFCETTFSTLINNDRSIKKRLAFDSMNVLGGKHVSELYIIFKLSLATSPASLKTPDMFNFLIYIYIYLALFSDYILFSLNFDSSDNTDID